MKAPSEASSGEECKTRYPLVLIHGAGFRDDNKFYNYWGRIPRFLASNGAAVFYSHQDAWGTIEDNARVLRENLSRILDQTGQSKVNLIAHSKGGLEARYLISTMGFADRVATLTTISTPHKGSVILDSFCRLPKFLYRGVAFFVDLFSRIFGDKHPDFYTASRQLSQQSCAAFNVANPDRVEVAYRSFAGKMRNPFSNLLFFWTYCLVRIFEGPNDGLVTVESAKWGDFRGEIVGSGLRGVAHSDEIDLYRSNSRSFNIVGFYCKLASDLKNEGF